MCFHICECRSLKDYDSKKHSHPTMIKVRITHSNSRGHRTSTDTKMTFTKH